MTKDRKVHKLTLPDWMSGDVLDAWNSWLDMRKKKKYVLTARAFKSCVKELDLFRKQGMDVVKVIDNADAGNWKKFYPVKDFVMVKEKPVQPRQVKADSPELRELREKINIEGRRIAKAKSWGKPEDRAIMANLNQKMK